MSTSPAHPAATVVVLRQTDQPIFEILMVKRNDKVAFMAGAYVFPGGRVDDEDRRRAAAAAEAAPVLASRFDDLSLEDELAYRFGAVRELAEEAGVEADATHLTPLAHWVTPDSESRRYDTRFFLARMPAGQDARHDDGEMTELAWVTPLDALERARRGQIILPPPTWTTIKQLLPFGRIADAMGWAQRRRIVRVQPILTRDDGQTMLTLPGDPLHPTIPGWEVPEETRFVLTQGKGWTPQRP